MKRARERPRRRSLATLAPALILAGYAIFDLGSERSRAISILAKNTARHLGLPLARVQANVDDQVVRGWVRFSFSAGIFLAFLAAGLAVAAVLVSRAGARDEQAGAALLPSSRSSFLQPGEIIVDTVGAWRGGERASAVTLAAIAGAGTAIGFSNSLGPLSPGKGAIAGAIGGGAGAMIGSLIDKRRARKRSDPAGEVRMKVILTLTSERLLVCAAALRQEDRTLVEEIPLEGIADVSVATRKRLGVEVGAAITVGLHDDAEAKTFTVTGSPAPGVRFADALRAAIAGAVPAR